MFERHPNISEHSWGINKYFLPLILQERRVKMRRLGVIVGLLFFLCSGASAVDYRGVGNWTDPNNWSDGVLPSGAVEVKIRGEDTILTLNTRS